MATRHGERQYALIAAKVKAARIFFCGTISELAAVTALSSQALLSAEKPEHNSSIDTLVRICNVTKMPPAWLFDESFLLCPDWEKLVVVSRITKNTNIPEMAPWSEFVGSQRVIRIDTTQYGRLRGLSSLLGVQVDSLALQLINEGLVVKEAQFQPVMNETFDVDLFQAVVEMFEEIERTGKGVFAKEEKSQIIKSVYLDLASSGTQASDVSATSLLKLLD